MVHHIAVSPQWLKKGAQVPAEELPRFPCYAFNGNPVLEVVCKRVSIQPAGNREYCAAHTCQSPWRIILEPKGVEVKLLTPTPAAVVPPLQRASTPSRIEVHEETPAPTVVKEKKLRGMGSRGRKNIAALEKASAALRIHKKQLLVKDLIEAAAHQLGMSVSGLRAFYARYVTPEIKARLLYGESGRKVTRAEAKFRILMQVRDEMRERGEPSPNKKELALAAAKRLGMTPNSAQGYVYDDLTQEQVELLEFAEQFLTLDQQIAVLKQVRQGMRERGLPAPLQTELAKAAAPLLRQKPTSVRTLIRRLDAAVRAQLKLSGSHSRKLVGVEPDIIREGFLGAIAVLRLRTTPLTISNLRQLLKLKPVVVKSYLEENPDIRALLN